ncbi:MAG: hypothetical protein ACRD1F_09120, partial [Terriglobales bacterium]
LCNAHHEAVEFRLPLPDAVDGARHWGRVVDTGSPTVVVETADFVTGAAVTLEARSLQLLRRLA